MKNDWQYAAWPMLCDECRWSTAVSEIYEGNGQYTRMCDRCRINKEETVNAV